jgi:thiol-disulfide isomerase/thioredoxin
VTSLSEVERANVLVQAVSLGLREPKSDARNARLETFVDELDGLSAAVLDQKFSVHSRMNGFYRGDDIDAGIIKHSTWLIDTAKACTPELKQKYGPSAVSAYVNMAEAWAGQGRNDDALELLRKAKTDWPNVPSIAARIDPVLERYLLVGRPAAAITAPQWLNGPTGASSLEMKGRVTLLEFTAHWCGPCKESYPGIKRLLAQYGSRGFRVVFSTQLYGYFGVERNLTPEVELERDRAYFEHENLSIPIAVGDRLTSKVVDGKTVYLRDPNDEAYKVGGIPQIHLIDKQGRIRLIMVGYDDANEPRLAKLVEELLREK